MTTYNYKLKTKNLYKMPKKIKEKDTRLFMRISSELKTKIQTSAKEKNIPVSTFVMDAIKNHLNK